MKKVYARFLFVWAFSGASMFAANGGTAGRVLPDELTVNVGDVENAGTNLTLVLTKRSMRSDTYRCGVWSDSGFKEVVFPVCTYRGYVKEDSLIHVNGNIEPGGILNANLTENRDYVATIRDLKIDVPVGKSTPTMSSGNKIVPLASLRRRQLPTPGGYLVPRVPMRLSKWVITAPKTYTEQFEMEKVVAQIEQRWNDGDFIFARDVGTAWVIHTLVLVDPKSTKPIDWEAVGVSYNDDNLMYAGVSGVGGGNSGKGNHLGVSGAMHSAFILLHEGAHLYGNGWHQIDNLDGLFGGHPFFGGNNVQVLVDVTETPGRWCHRGEDAYPGAVYSGPLPPYAMQDFANTRKDTPVTVDVIENDYDGNGEAVSLKAVEPTSHKGGSVVVAKDGKAVYTPPAGFVGQDWFGYTVVDSAGVGNRTGYCKVDVRADGLAAHYDFEQGKKGDIEWMKTPPPGDWRIWYYNTWDKRPDDQKVVYRFPNSGPYGGEAVLHWINYEPVPGVHGSGLLNPVGGMRSAQVDFTDVGDPGRESMSVSIWALFQKTGWSVIVGKGGTALWDKVTINGWSIVSTGTEEGFRFIGNVARILQDEKFELQSQEPVASNTWYHLVMVMDREQKKLRAYVNNEELTYSRTKADIPDGVIEHFSPMRLFNGSGYKGWSAGPMLVDELKIFTAALTPKQVAELYAEGKNAKVPELPASKATE